MRFKCCRKFYGCRECHDEVAGLAAIRWDVRADGAETVAMCGAGFSLREYLHTREKCPGCAAARNPGCVRHRHLYFKGMGVDSPPAGVPA